MDPYDSPYINLQYQSLYPHSPIPYSEPDRLGALGVPGCQCLRPVESTRESTANAEARSNGLQTQVTDSPYSRKFGA